MKKLYLLFLIIFSLSPYYIHTHTFHCGMYCIFPHQCNKRTAKVPNVLGHFSFFTFYTNSYHMFYTFILKYYIRTSTILSLSPQRHSLPQLTQYYIYFSLLQEMSVVIYIFQTQVLPLLQFFVLPCLQL